MSAFDKEYLSKLDVNQQSITVNSKELFLKYVVSVEGKKSVVWQVADRYNNLFALKLATFEDYIDRSFDEEMTKAALVSRYSHFARIDGAEIKEFGTPSKKIKCVAFVEEWVDGIDVENLKNETVTIPFILAYIEKLSEVLSILKHLKLRHDDLHTGNVLIVNPKAGVLKESLEIKIVDLGSLKDYHTPLKPVKKGIDDSINFALHVKTLLNKLLFLDNGERRILSSKESNFADESIKILSSIVDSDKARALTSPFRINQTFQSLRNRIFTNSPKSLMELADPFDYITAEQINSDQLLIELFASSCPWIVDIISPNPILLTGPRGCGKSMLFRRYSLKALLSVDDKLLDEIQIAAFYISCSADLSNRLSIISTKTQALTFKEEIIHYFNLILLKEIVSTLKIIVERSDSFSKFGIDDNLQDEIFAFITNCLKIKTERKLSLQGVKPITHLLELIKFEGNSTYASLVRRAKVKDFTPFSFISDVTSFLSEKIPFFNTRKITFLVDDYSVHRISEEVQSLLNMVIWDRQSSHIFKVSSEKYGTVRTMYNNTSADLSREYTEVDIGRAYINLSESSKELKRFSAELLNHRLKLAKYKGKAEGLIGNSNYSEGSLGKQIRAGITRNEIFHGLETISQVCSGDISTLLELFRQIFRDSEVKKDTVDLLVPSRQHGAITSASKNFLELTKTFHPYGAEMYKIVINFGTLSKKILVEGKLQREFKTGNLVPNETTRIEIEETEFPEELSEINENIYKELIRRAIFIELETSRGRHTLGITNRLQLRRIYCPSFGVSLAKTAAIKWPQSMFKAFLNDPASICELEFQKWKQTDKENQQELFR